MKYKPKSKSPIGLVGSILKPTIAEVILASALERHKIDYTASPDMDNQSLNFELGSGSVLRVRPVVSAGYRIQDTESLYLIAQGLNPVEISEWDAVKNVDAVISNWR